MRILSITIHVTENYKEILISELADIGFHGFEEISENLVAYIGLQKFKPEIQQEIENLLKKYPGENYIFSKKEITGENWNKAWETCIQPQVIGDFIITPTWEEEPAEEDKITILIDPKMSFGTGYHATTRLMLKALSGIVTQGDKVLDVGTGTGILCIAAIKLGADTATGVDIDEWSYQNALENIGLNGVADQITIKHGSIETVPEDQRYPVILANINRNVINELAGNIHKRLSSNGKLLLSGLLKQDMAAIKKQPWYKKMTLEQQWYENEWMALLLRK